MPGHPAVYGQSAQKILDMNPEWILAEHGGPYVFNAEDYRRRVLWGQSAAKACDALCVSGDHRTRPARPREFTVKRAVEEVLKRHLTFTPLQG